LHRNPKIKTGRKRIHPILRKALSHLLLVVHRVSQHIGQRGAHLGRGLQDAGVITVGKHATLSLHDFV
jgi:hypothetical protein